jgi:hypothetical protein
MNGLPSAERPEADAWRSDGARPAEGARTASRASADRGVPLAFARRWSCCRAEGATNPQQCTD